MSQRRGACPALFTPMQTGDGLLARILPAEDIAPAAFAALCAAARRHGNGTIEVSGRGSLQVRGLTAASAPRFADEVATLGIAALGVPILSDPLPDDPAALIDAAATAVELRTAIADANLLLAPKLCIIIDGGGALHFDTLSADIRLQAFVRDGETRLSLALAGDAATATSLGSISVEAAAEVVVEVLRVIADRGDVRASEILRAEGIGAFIDLPHLQSDHIPLAARAPVEMIGSHPLRDGRRALGVGLAFSHAEAETLIALVESATAHGARAVRPAPSCALLLVGITEHDVSAMTREAEGLGFITRPDDPRLRIVACPGAPACVSGFIAARKLASELADFLSPRPEGRDVWRGFGMVHISGCAKGCAHPQAAALTIVGSEHGCGIVEYGTARATPQTYVDPRQLAAHLAHRVSEPANG